MPGSSQPIAPDNTDVVMFLSGKITTADGTPVPSDASIQRICHNRVRQQVYTSPRGDFSMEMRNMADSFVDASGDGDTNLNVANQASVTGGIPRRELEDCELRTSVAGFRANSVYLAGVLTTTTGTIDVGNIVIERTGKVPGGALNAAPYNVPNDARKAYLKGLDAKKNDKLSNAQQSFEKAVAIYPRYTYAWFQLGLVLQKENQNDAARTAYTKATSIDPKFLPPYVSLAFLACAAANWAEAVTLTDHVLSMDPVKQPNIGGGGYIVDLDPMNFGEAYFYNALANYRLNRFDSAEKSALKAENHADPQGRFPQVHLLLAEIYYRKNNYPVAIAELRNYLELVPQGKDVDRVRERLAKLEKLNGAASTDKPAQQ
jgi:hypothetical protein